MPEGFTNWGDWLIWRSTGAFGDFRMDACLSIIRTERFSRDWFRALQSNPDDIRRVLARYKEHVTYWNIPIDVIRRELTDFAIELQRNPQEILQEFDRLPASRFQPAHSVADGFCRIWKAHVMSRPNQPHQIALRNESDLSMSLFCTVDGELLGRSNVLGSDVGIVHQLFNQCITRP
jgi:hypothetical protein